MATGMYSHPENPQLGFWERVLYIITRVVVALSQRLLALSSDICVKMAHKQKEKHHLPNIVYTDWFELHREI